jgi:hypothetical protein
MRRKWILYCVLTCVAGVALVLVTTLPRAQLAGQTMAHLSVAIETFVRQHHRMPRGLVELKQANILSDDSTGMIRVMPTQHLLYGLSDVCVNWSFRAADAREVDGRLLGTRTAGSIYILRSRIWWWPGTNEESMQSSVNIYRELTNPVGVIGTSR